MANVLRLMVALFALLLFTPEVRAQTFTTCTSNNSTGDCQTKALAEANALRVAQLQATSDKNQCNSFGHPNCDRFVPKRLPDSGPWVSAPYAGWMQVNYSVCANVGCSTWSGSFNRKYPPGPTESECEARNSNPETAPGSGLFLDAEVGSRCVGGCVLDIVGDPTEVVQGRRQGQPANFYRFNREYTGDTCEGDDPAPDDEFTEDPSEEGQVCNVTAGVCVNEDGDTEYCTFNSDGTPSACVPAVDYDNDGVPDDDDTTPDDPDNGADDGEGDEGDNEAAGGALCPHKGGQPPTCKGDGIQCNLLLQAYLGRCGLERTNDANAQNYLCSIESPLVCTNMSIKDCHALAMQKKTACSSEKIANALAGTAEPGDEGTAVDPEAIWEDSGDELGLDDLDVGGWLSSRTCPVFPSITVFGNEVSLSSVHADYCAFLSVGAMLTLLLASFQCARILGET